jgi:hypothetical protein
MDEATLAGNRMLQALGKVLDKDPAELVKDDPVLARIERVRSLARQIAELQAALRDETRNLTVDLAPDPIYALLSTPGALPAGFDAWAGRELPTILRQAVGSRAMQELVVRDGSLSEAKVISQLQRHDSDLDPARWKEYTRRMYQQEAEAWHTDFTRCPQGRSAGRPGREKKCKKPHLRYADLVSQGKRIIRDDPPILADRPPRWK